MIHTITTLILATTMATSAQAYTIQNDYVTDGIMNAGSHIASNMKFIKGEGSAMEVAKSKKNLAVCMVDQLITDANEFDVDDATINQYISTMVKFYRTPEDYRNMSIRPDDQNYILELQYRCVNEHPSMKQALYDEANRDTRFNNTCESMQNVSCVTNLYRERLKALKQKHMK